MPRTRRRHHSRSRSRSRSHSHDRDREPKRRRVDSPDSSHHRRSVSSEKEVSPEDVQLEITNGNISEDMGKEDQEINKEENTSIGETSKMKTEEKLSKNENLLKSITPKKGNKQEDKLKLKQERDEQKRKEKEEKLNQKRKEKEEREEQKRKEKEEKLEQKRKEKEEKEEQKRKEKEEKEEQRRKEKEEKEEQKRKEREEKELKKNKEKKKKEEQIEKEKAAFANYFRKSAGATDFKKWESESEPEKSLAFMPFAIKSDMRLAPIIRINLSVEQKQILLDKFNRQEETILYLDEIKNGKKLGLSTSTWPVEEFENDIIILENDDIGECVEEQPKAKKMRAKLLKFHENKRPAYFGTWRKKTTQIKSRKPFALDKEFFDYEVDSDDDWEEEEPGESLHGSDDEEKEEKDDYEVDNDFFVPHGYLSDEEVEVEECSLSPETQKQKLKILQEEFDEEMKLKTEKIKPRLIGCIWESKMITVQDAIHKFLEDRMMMVTGTIQIQKRDLNTSKTVRKPLLSKELITDFLCLIHGNTNNQAFLVNEFLNYLTRNNIERVSKASLLAQLKLFAKWKKCPEDGVMFNKYCWYVEEEIRAQYNRNLELPNSWVYTESGCD